MKEHHILGKITRWVKHHVQDVPMRANICWFKQEAATTTKLASVVKAERGMKGFRPSHHNVGRTIRRTTHEVQNGDLLSN